MMLLELLYAMTINILMHKSYILPTKPEEKQILINAIQQEIAKLCPDTNATPENLQKKAILEERLKLINSWEDYNESRLSNLQKIFKHYSTHWFRSGQKYDFDQIGYLNEHLNMQRFFAFINDFKLNQITINGQTKQLADRKDIILIFKKSSSNARNLDFPEFIACLERLFLLLFNENQGYKEKQQRLFQQKQQRAIQAKKREKQKQQRLKLKAQKAGINLNPTPPPPPPKKAPKIDSPNNPQVKPVKQNDQMMNEMMKDFEIVNPNDQINKAVNEVKQQNVSDKLYMITDSEKIESYMLRIGIDDKKQIERKLRYFEKANYKYFEVDELQKYREGQPRKKDEQKGNQPLNLKSQLTSIHEEWKKERKEVEKSNANRFISVMDKLSEREVAKSRIHMSRSLSREQYDHKRKRMDQKFTKRQLDLMYPTAKDRVNKRKSSEEQTVYYNLQMLHRSTPNQLPINKIYPDRYVSSDPTDSIYLQEYSFPRNMGMGRAVSSFARDKSDIIQSTKRRAHELQNQQAKRISRLTINLHQNHHYLQKFLERKW